jgi:hypothetical protein
MGQWIADEPSEDDKTTWAYGIDAAPGKLLLAEDFDTPEYAIAAIAQEFGHACTRFQDLERRGAHINDEWTSELAADWYACKKWGFAREIRQTRKVSRPEPSRPFQARGKFRVCKPSVSTHEKLLPARG